MEDIDMESDKEGTYYRKWKTWNQGDLSIEEEDY